MNGTARLSLPFLSPGQAQKEFTQPSPSSARHRGCSGGRGSTTFRSSSGASARRLLHRRLIAVGRMDGKVTITGRMYHRRLALPCAS